jgi:plastocyanin
MVEKNLTRRQALKVAGAAALGGLAVSAIGMARTALPDQAASTIDLQLAVVPDFRGDGWDSFVPTQLVVRQGDTVNITIFNRATDPHGILITGAADKDVKADIPVATKDAKGMVIPSQTVVTFVAKNKGAFPYICTVACGDGHTTMVGTLLVL